MNYAEGRVSSNGVYLLPHSLTGFWRKELFTRHRVYYESSATAYCIVQVTHVLTTGVYEVYWYQNDCKLPSTAARCMVDEGKFKLCHILCKNTRN